MTKLVAQTYIGAKTVRAAPMNLLDYTKLRGRVLTEGPIANEEGYLVEYTDGGKPNVPGFEGYVSWSPKEVFERSYKVQPDSDLPKYQQHALAEHAEMAARIDKLHTFFKGEVFSTLPQVEQELYRNQSLYLRLYNDQLAQRIALFAKE